MVVIGTAGWSIPADQAHRFMGDGTALERYARVLAGVEVNSSFHRPHRASTWARWGASVPEAFRFAVKLPKDITHVRKLVDCADPLATFLSEVGELGDRLAVLLVQLPPKLAFAPDTAARFFDLLATRSPAQVVCEPRHPSWFEVAPDALLAERRVARVGADPAPVPAAAEPGGWRGFSYRRLHGSPDRYRSSYGSDELQRYAGRLRSEGAGWCMFDNTAASAATANALDLVARLTQA